MFRAIAEMRLCTERASQTGSLNTFNENENEEDSHQ